MRKRDLDDSAYAALARFRHQLRKFIAFSESAARKVGLEPRQHQLLLALRGLDPATAPSVQTLAEHLVLRHHTVVELLDRLEAADLVRRVRLPEDRRRARVSITKHGLEVLRQLSAAHLDELRMQAPALVGVLNGVLLASRRAS
jgi:DNA-binding MarR family transcriptional regulator